MGSKYEESKYSEMKIEQAAERAMRDYETVFTDFLTPRDILTAKRINCDSKAWGGYLEAERKMCAFIPFGVDDIAFPLVILEIDAGKQQITHPEVLGSVIGLGLKREKIGDIVPNGTRAYIVVSNSISDYLLSELRTVGRNNVTVRVADEIVFPQSETEEATINVASVRLDAVLAEGLRLNRADAQALIEGDRVQVNFALAEKSDMRLKENDVISVRGFGRIEIAEISDKLSRKGRVFVKIKKKTRK